MKTISGALSTALQQQATYLCRCWHIALTNGEDFYFTDLNRFVTFDSLIYRYDPGMRVSAIVAGLDGYMANATIEIAARSDLISLLKVRQGGLDGASFNLFAVDWRDPDTYGAMPLFTGSIGAQPFNDKGHVSIEITGALRSNVDSVKELLYSKTCRARLGDAQCQADLVPTEVLFAVGTVLDVYRFTSTDLILSRPDNYFQFGDITWQTGLNTGKTMSAKASTDGTGLIELTNPPYDVILAGDLGTIRAGCDKNIKTCELKFNNVVNFRGEPYMPATNTLSTTYIDWVSGRGA